MNRRVVVTGIGVITSIGNNAINFWDSIKANRHGFTIGNWFPEHPDNQFPMSKVKDFSALEFFEKKELRRTDLISQYAVVASMEALKDCGSDLKNLDPYRVGVIISSGIGGLLTSEEQILNYHNKGNGRVSVFTIPMMIGNMPAGVTAIKTGFKGSNYCPVSACASSTHAIGESFRAIKHGYLDAAVTGGTECCHLGFAYAGFNNMHALTRNTDPDRASIPFDKERSGFVLGDGAGILILEEYEKAKKRGAKIYAEICGYGSTCDAHHETSPDPNGLGGAKAMELAVKESGLSFTDINYINAHGTSTEINDKVETKAIKETFKEHSKNIAINSTKSMTGHILGAAGAVEAAATVLQIKNDIVHKTLGYKIPDPLCDLDYVTDCNRQMKITAALSNSLGFGGHNACICFKPII